MHILPYSDIVIRYVSLCRFCAFAMFMFVECYRHGEFVNIKFLMYKDWRSCIYVVIYVVLTSNRFSSACKFSVGSFFLLTVSQLIFDKADISKYNISFILSLVNSSVLPYVCQIYWFSTLLYIYGLSKLLRNKSRIGK